MRALFIVLLCWSTAAIAQTPPAASASQEAGSVPGELSRRSGLPEREVDSLLADCDLNQQSMYFCSWRDQIAAERALQKVLADKLQQASRCASSMASEVAAWEQRRDRSCEQSSAQQWGEGSMKPTARNLCISKETSRMTKLLQSRTSCPLD